MSPLNEIKILIVEFSGLAKDALHIYVALVIFLGACLLFGWRASQWKPLLLVLVVIIVGEIIDIRDTMIIDRQIYPDANWHDIWNTMLAPFMLFLFARFTKVFKKQQPIAPDELPSGDEP